MFQLYESLRSTDESVRAVSSMRCGANYLMVMYGENSNLYFEP